MSNKHKNVKMENHEEKENTKDVLEQEEAAVEDTIAEEVAKENTELSELDKLKADVEAREKQIEDQKKEYLFLMAEFDNFRKRTMRERTELIKNAAESTLKGILPIVDDFERGLAAMKDDESAKTLREGVELIYNKLVKYLEQSGVKAMETSGKKFDTEFHEAVAMVPATDEKMKGCILDTVEKGYMYNDKVLRHAKVVVCQ